MARGPGRYDHEVTLIREGVKARTVVLLVLDGDRGTGFSVQTVSPEDLAALPAALRTMADQIEADQT